MAGNRRRVTLVVGEIGRGLGAMAVVGLLLGGVPLLLAHLAGWPLPREVPALSTIRHALAGSTITDSTVIKILAVVGWLTWAHFLVCLAAEAAAWGRRRTAAVVPLGGLLQPLARQLVISVTMLAGAIRPPSVPVLPVAAVVEVSAPLAVVDAPAPVLVPAGAAPHTPVPVAPSAPTCVVQPRDSLWKLAEQHLGDGLRWRDLWHLNRSRTFPDGRTFTDPDLIHPGWELAFPLDAVGLDTAFTPASAPRTSRPTAPPTAPATTDDSEPAPPTTSPSLEAQPTGEAPTVESKPSGDRTTVPAAALPVAGSLVAAGIVATLTHRRLAQQRQRRAMHTIPVPDPALADGEARLRAAAADAPTDRLEAVLRALGASLAGCGDQPIPPISALSISDDRVEILFDAPVQAPAGLFSVAADGRAWTLTADVDATRLAAAGQGHGNPFPALGVIGRIDDRQILTDLEQPLATAIIGSSEDTTAVLHSLMLDLATTARAADVRLVSVGELPVGLAGLDRVEVVADESELVALLTAEAWATRMSLTAGRYDSTVQARVRQPGDPWTPVVAFASDLTPTQADQLVGLVAGWDGVGLVIATVRPPTAPCRRITVHEGEAHLDDLGFGMATAAPLPAGLIEPAVELLDHVSSNEAGEPLELEEDEPAPKPALTVRVLGPVETDGGERPVDRPKCLELVTYLALHPKGVDEGRIKNALWRDAAPSMGAFNETVSRARRCLGYGPDGQHLLPHLTGGRYRLDPSVTTDLHVLEAAFRAARVTESDAALNDLADALDAIRGLPFEGTRGFEWAYAEGIVARIEALVSEAARLLAERSLERGEALIAVSAAVQGVKVCPADERLYQLRMRAHAELGDRAGIDASMTELCAVLEVALPGDHVLSETVAVHRTAREILR